MWLRGPCLPVQIDRDVRVLEADLADEPAQIVQHLFRVASPAVGELLVVDRQDERRSAALLLGELGEVAIAGHAEDLHPFVFDRLGQRANPQAGCVFGTKVLVDDDDRKPKLHGVWRSIGWGRSKRSKPYARLNHRMPQQTTSEPRSNASTSRVEEGRKIDTIRPEAHWQTTIGRSDRQGDSANWIHQ